MGKKSKKQNAAATAEAKSVTVGAVSVASGGDAVRGKSGSIPKKVRCVSCLALIKDPAKGHACPGCSMLYCWRCEKKSFIRCPNGDNCSLPLRRCDRCVTGRTLSRELHAIGEEPPHHSDGVYFSAEPHTWHRHVFDDIIEKRDDLTLEALPFTTCGGSNCFGSELSRIECGRCAEGPTTKKLSSCSLCGKARCRSCELAAGEPVKAAFGRLFRDAGKRSPGVILDEFRDAVSATAPDAMAHCDKCEQQTCYECLDLVEIKCIVTLILLSARGVVNVGERGSDHTFQCSRCRWSTKPCTNPTCPNEVGIPTKRCGGCHIDRYCSVECQAAAYPDHVGRCEKIRSKRAAAGKESIEE